MKKITYFHLKDCPYCKQANRVIEELKQENPRYQNLEIEMIEENEHPEIIEAYDYHAVPCMWIGQEKIYEGKLFESYEACKENVRRVFEVAL
ncbi:MULTISPECIES: glutaredoxin domain-containing protein [Terrabacteria group]|uniref:glutaredoxin domain-containing protein n=1 Tax=Bacillati TaxID=1783272 RepID=UPI0019397A9B|nr:MULTISPECIES: glutaredoxin domain-containing protein [Terrabacteria group]MBW9212713.1 thioredoxin family protein [Trueperella sp. zg.1013]QRG86540.1 thioredoxin family protein [Bulleidia sp. zg-1006]